MLPAASVCVTDTVSGPLSRPETSSSPPDSVQLPDPSAVTWAVTAGFEPSETDTSIVALAAPVPSTRTSPSSTALTRPSPSIGVVITGAAGIWLSRVIVSVAAAEVLPAGSVCVTDTVSDPLSRAETSSSLPPASVQLPDPSAVTVADTVVVVSEMETSTVAFASAPPPATVTSLSSAALTRPSPSIGVVIVGAVTRVSRLIVSVAAAEVLPAASVCVTDTVSGPLSRPETSSSPPDSVQLPDPSAVTWAVTAGFEPSEIDTSIVALASPVPSTRTSPSSTALTRPSPSIGVVITGAAGAVRS